MSNLAQPFYVERDGLRGVIMPMPDGRFNWMTRVTVTSTGTCDTFEDAHNDLANMMHELATSGEVVQEELGAPATVVSIADARVSASDADKGEGLLE